MANGTIGPEKKTPAREVIAAGFLIFGPLTVIFGATMIWGWGGTVLVCGILATVLGVTMGLSRTGKG